MSVWPGGDSPGQEGRLSSSPGWCSVSSQGGEEALSPQSSLQLDNPRAPPGAGTERASAGDGLCWSLVKLLPPRPAQQALAGRSWPVPARRGQPAGGSAQLAASSDRAELAVSSVPGGGGGEPALEPLHGREPRHRGPGRQTVLCDVQGLQSGPVVGLGQAGQLGLLRAERGEEGEEAETDPELQ